MFLFIHDILDYIQDTISCRHLSGPQFIDKRCLGLVGMAGFWLGVMMGVHIAALFISVYIKYYLEIHIEHMEALVHWSVYMTLLCSFHLLEFYTVAAYNPRELSFDSFLINHSKSYTVAAVCSWIEYWIETYYFDSIKHNLYAVGVGMYLVFIGQLVRYWAMRTCGEHFSHIIMTRRRPGHELVTTGIYSYLRHPSYFGWFYWSIGTQILLCNPLCTVAYTLASWRFFAIRIPYEEELLVDFYREQYVSYIQTTIIGIPFISSKSQRFLQLRLNLKE
mmetsp:Transcript_20349/g.20471  ORF Transcript_20349/g.20471 Transcript_20349/m.20471 type:complete len:277 (-) Transcript_20349:27-857(-)